MRSLVAAFILLLTIAGCTENETTKLRMKGAYTMLSQVINDGTADSVIDRKQLKIYTDKFMMYASPNVADSFANFGIAEYEVKDGKVYEYIFYRASQGDRKDTAILNIEQHDHGYRQVIDRIMIDGKEYKLTEEYESAGRAMKSPLDGAWKKTRSMFTSSKGDSSVNNNPLEYKTFQSGYFIWAITTRDSANQRTSVFGYGIFEMDGDDKIRETLQNCTYSREVGKTYEVAIQMNGNDEYQQTITFANGDKSTEVYQRLK